MNTLLSKFVLQRLGATSTSAFKTASRAGFTLLELLVAALLAGLVVSGLLTLVVQLLEVDARESSRSETQRDMQLAMDYISTELRQAVYVYTGECLYGQAGSGCPQGGNSLATRLQGPLGANARPVLAFWRHEPLPSALRDDCRDDAAQATAAGVPCITGSSYALIVYALSTENPNAIWQGRARIVRYALTQFTSTGTATPGYRNPFDQAGGTTTADPFGSWTPPAGAALGGQAAVLTDYVDFGEGATATAVAFPTPPSNLCPETPPPTPTRYSFSPVTPPGPIGFYTCVSPSTPGSYQEVLLFLRGNAFGRPSVFTDTSFLTTLETRVQTRGVLERNGN
ncbi:MAG: prepilin-type N-terminal cleavage/methylation domain-containing protein [Kaiparowitsia implicata GSE-PSE-MK54-09C]|jgi:prepilin-type N-terminal cleavage/methylation domain-containing protein|nr:prepilin-type N-terminal cleavage/methylation domain-containing protein [Kaiparowitsia implicata GSE-PSE-MK54-09C]